MTSFPTAASLWPIRLLLAAPMKCPRCQHDNRSHAKFCEQCAAPLQRQCANCQSVLPESAKFCPECAHPVFASGASPLPDRAERVIASAPAVPAAEGDRRQATVLVADISGYTALCARLDAEQVQALLGRFYDVTDGIIANYGGHVIDHAGDATLAVFGAPVAHDNDSERAARAALDMHMQSAGISDPSGHALSLHVGIASGEVVAATIAAGAQPKYAVTGEAVNLAARLNAVAQSGQTIISDAVWRSVSRAFDAQPLGEVPIKGFSKPVSLWKRRASVRALLLRVRAHAASGRWSPGCSMSAWQRLRSRGSRGIGSCRDSVCRPCSSAKMSATT